MMDNLLNSRHQMQQDSTILYMELTLFYYYEPIKVKC